jgi:hypothetical protein
MEITMKVSLDRKDVANLITKTYTAMYGDEKSISVRITPYGDHVAEVTITDAAPMQEQMEESEPS